jgi:hypothetical protein
MYFAQVQQARSRRHAQRRMEPMAPRRRRGSEDSDGEGDGGRTGLERNGVESSEEDDGSVASISWLKASR